MTEELKRSLWEAHSGLCFYTGIPITMFDMEVDYIYPLSKGGGDELENLVPCSTRANLQKSNIYNENITKQIMMFNALVYTPKVQKLFSIYKMQTTVLPDKYSIEGYKNIFLKTPIIIDKEFINEDGKIYRYDGLHLPVDAKVFVRKSISINGKRKEYKKTFKIISSLEKTIKKADDYIRDIITC